MLSDLPHDRLRSLWGLLLGMLAFAAPLGYGGVGQRAQTALVLASFLLLLLISFHAGMTRSSLVGRHARAPLVILLMWMAWVALPLVPLPGEMIALLSPERSSHLAQLQSVTLFFSESSVAGAAVTFPLSADVQASTRRLVLTLAYISIFICSAWICRTRQGRIGLLAAIIVTGVLQAAIGGYEALSKSASDIFGHTQAYRGYASGTLVNRNHFAGLMQFTLASAWALVLVYSHPDFRDGQRLRRAVTIHLRLRNLLRRMDDPVPLLWLSMVLMLAGLLLSQSRMGNAAAAAALTVGSLLYWHGRGGLTPRRVAYGGLTVFALAILFWSAGHWQGLGERYQSTLLEEESRWRMWPELWQLMQAYSVTGSGLGSFTVVFPAYRQMTNPFFYDYAHNDYAQFWIETGLVGVALLAVLVLLTLHRALRGVYQQGRSCRALHLAALMSILAVAVHSTTDFNLQIPCNALILMMLMGGCWGCPSHSVGVGVAKTSEHR